MSTAARQVTPIDREAEDRLAVVLEEASSALSRKEIFARVADDFDDEEDLAKALGRLVADGRLVRSTRPRFNRPDETAYATPKVTRLTAIASAAQQTEIAANDGRELLREVIDDKQAPSAHGAPNSGPIQKENDMGRKTSVEVQELVKNTLYGAREPLGLADLSKSAGVTEGSAKSALKALMKEGQVESTGKGRAVKYGPKKGSSESPAPESAAAPSTLTPRAPYKAIPTDATRKFGYFSDGSVSIECEQCKGTLSSADLKAFRAFAQRFEDTTK